MLILIFLTGTFVGVLSKISCSRYSVVLHRPELGAEVSPHRCSTVQPHEGPANGQPTLGASGEVPRKRARRVRPRHDTALLCDKRRRQRCEAAVQGVATGAVGVVRVPHDQLRSGRGAFAMFFVHFPSFRCDVRFIRVLFFFLG